ncbi:leucyl-tRNA synthetase [endosymbiont of Sipalinus gigas]|uniref:class I tRNA ligase family protein n=1 Tax=endosymbiont of Sipalinus gigas TaxID=1972134 RepID=UPI000DC72C7A|nr:class I tRNA ligase family protein [endosymbiont of Sipalinus gigas]BBA85317.1 leucyl-tRNA synthetase [endosymbiont of Sipalinus gigas]
MKNYPHKSIESCIQKYWYKNKTFSVKEDFNKKKYYCLSMFPYTSGNLHIGHIRNYTIGDIISRFQRMLGKNVLYPIGWDAFGLPAENAAIKNNINPKEWTALNIYNMRKQIKMLGFSFDWDREIITCLPDYYKWEQFFFKKLYKNNIAYKKLSEVNWCKTDKTVLANEQVINDKCWRCNSITKKIKIKQWFLKITKYSNKLLKNLKFLKNWPNKVKLMQSNWIGKIKWLEIHLYINIRDNKYKLFLYINNIYEFINASYIMMSNDNILIKKNILNKDDNIKVFNPLNKKYISIKIFDKKYMIKFLLKNKNLNIISEKINNIYYEKYNKLKVNFFSYYSFFYFDIFIDKKENIKDKIKFLFEKKILVKKIKFNLKDWCISRQRYWGAIIPTVNINKKIYLIPNNKIPLSLTYDEYSKNIKILINKKIGIIEKDTFDTFIESSWYYIKFTCPNYNFNIIDKKSANYWLPIDQYIGGIEHSTMHLLYFRFYHKLFNDFGFLKTKEPVNKLLCHGMVNSKTYYFIDENKNKIWISQKDIIINNNRILYKNKEVIYGGISKMSKSKNNGINPIDIIKKYGADTLRIFIIFSSPIEHDMLWDETNIIGVYRFLNRIWNISDKIKCKNNNNNNKISKLELDFYLKLNENIIFVTNLMNKNNFNSIISILMKLTNELITILNSNNFNYILLKKTFLIIIKLLYPFAPHISFVIWKKLGNKNSIDYENWPKIENYYPFLNIEKKILFLIGINGKIKDRIYIKKDTEKDEIFKIIKNKLIIFKIIENKKYNIIFIKNKLINFIFK